MISASPHLYRQGAQDKSVRPEIVERALAQARSPERQGLPAILTLGHLAHLTGADYLYLRSVVMRERDGYRTFIIRKRGGGQRLIAAPEPKLAAIQRWIVDEILVKLSSHFASCAYSRKASPIGCAQRHLRARWLVKADIHDFFESISERRAYFVFRNCGYQPLVSFELARLCTRVSTGKSVNEPQWQIERPRQPSGIAAYKSSIMGHLPQGAPTSPMLSNLVSVPLDNLFQKVADKYDMTYTRYSDDLTFSTSGDFTHRDAAGLMCDIERVLVSFGHALHQKKSRISPPGARKIVLGLLVDGDQLKLTREFRNRLSDHVRGIEKFGLAYHATHRHFASLWGMVRHIGGLLTYADAVDHDFATPLKARLSKSLKAQHWPSPSTSMPTPAP
jgi:RNA-directed DNA polymerase